MLIHCSMDDEEYDSDLSQSRRTAEISVGTQKQQEKLRIPPSVSKPVKRKRVGIGGKMYEDELMVLNVRLKRYGYESTIALCGILRMEYFLKTISSRKVRSTWVKTNHILEPCH